MVAMLVVGSRFGLTSSSVSCVCLEDANAVCGSCLLEILTYEQGDDRLLEWPTKWSRLSSRTTKLVKFTLSVSVRAVLFGNVYKGRVNKVLPGMQSAFVDIGLERDAFLYVSDVSDTVEEFDRLETGESDDIPEEMPDAATADSPQNGQNTRQRGGGRGRSGQRATQKNHQKIEELLTPGQEILVQVVKEPLGTKGARITCHVSVPGRFLVFMPASDSIGVSRKIDTRDERSRLRGIVRQFREEHDFTGGVIIRTAASKRSKEDITGDLSYFHQLWNETREKMDSLSAPAVLHQEESLVAKLLRDFLTNDFSAIRIDDQKEYETSLEIDRPHNAKSGLSSSALHKTFSYI